MCSLDPKHRDIHRYFILFYTAKRPTCLCVTLSWTVYVKHPAPCNSLQLIIIIRLPSTALTVVLWNYSLCSVQHFFYILPESGWEHTPPAGCMVQGQYKRGTRLVTKTPGNNLQTNSRWSEQSWGLFYGSLLVSHVTVFVQASLRTNDGSHL